ncbi:SGNH/GDSL hydrolase family protein [Dyadobacter sp. NIV53]|uniref:SGNH/GDSL hydrolase family protein n=1 Tax=Dyadobacter sp. NIV53 TaxID=2861765 RepID=UPI001C867777|nr:SGNH/GDSL hydrolase family protein [Dyadobacter sp. NIV53]
MKNILFLLFISCTATAQSDLIDISLKPFWKGKTMYNESVLMISKEGKPAEAQLLFKPKHILSVRNSALNIEYKKDVDWEYKDGKLKLMPGSSAVYMTNDELYPDSTKNVFPKKGGGKVLFHEGSYFHEHQLAITYKHAKNGWKGVIPIFQGENLPHTIEKLKLKQAIHLLLYGDSIAAGANASGKSSASPNLPDWGNLITEKLKRFYKASVTFTNTAVGGMDSKWGKNNVQKLVADHNPDLVIIAFGMNDGTGKMEPQQFKANIQEIIERVKENNKNTEFILVTPMLPNPESFFTGTQAEFKSVLEELTMQGIVLADMTTVHRELLKYKSYQDMTGNNINHPNDFLIRWYAQEIVGILVP